MMNRICEDCYWYEEERDMGARIPFCKAKSTIDPLVSCEQCSDYHNRYKKTNADKIRTMTDEELADILTADFCALLCGAPIVCDGNCVLKTFEWLKQEAKEGE